jgi:hypothetical protein
MNRLIAVIGICALTLSLGCATSRTTPDPDYVLYQEAMKNQKPLVSMEWSADGQRLTKLEIQPAVNIQQRQPDAPHPIWAVVNTAFKGVAMVMGIYATGDVIENFGAAVQGNSSYTSGGNMSGGDMAIPTTTTTTTTRTETITNPMSE